MLVLGIQAQVEATRLDMNVVRPFGLYSEAILLSFNLINDDGEGGFDLCGHEITQMREAKLETLTPCARMALCNSLYPGGLESMADQKQMELELVIVPQSGTLRELRQLRLDLYAEMEQALSGEGVKLEQASDSRSLDPAIIGAISVVLLPAVVDKLGDLLVDWLRRHNDISITTKVVIPDVGPSEITWNPRHHTVDEIKQLIASTVAGGQRTNE